LLLWKAEKAAVLINQNRNHATGPQLNIEKKV